MFRVQVELIKRYIKEKYKLGGDYEVFAGQDASVAMGKLDLSGKYLNEYGVTQ
jgi:hypothetical protein